MRALLIVALIWGAIAATATVQIAVLSTSPVVFLLLPGLIASMALSGNVHAFPLWIAALVNFGFYFLICLALGKIVLDLGKFVKGIRRQSKAQSHYPGSYTSSAT